MLKAFSSAQCQNWKKNNGKTLYNFGIDDAFLCCFFLSMHILRQSIYTYTIGHKQYTCDRQQSNTREYLRFRAIFMYIFLSFILNLLSYLLLTNSITANNSLKTLWIITGACNHTNRRNFPPFIIVIVHISKFTLQSKLQQITQGKNV